MSGMISLSLLNIARAMFSTAMKRVLNSSGVMTQP